ncbi:MAG TPA: TorF family putative porin [Sphingobium sp.]|nr:TorF family putative porin [Sphingobium sp.]
MRKSILGLSAVAFVAFAAPAMAEEASDDLGLKITGGAAVVSDYRFRGISQSDEDFAIQGNFTVAHESGLYVGVWGSSNTLPSGQGTEIDVIAGFAKEVLPGVTADIGATYYVYPNKLQILAANELIEPFVSLSGSVGPVWAKVGFAYAPEQDYYIGVNGQNTDAAYVWGDASVNIPNTPIKLKGHLGWSSSNAFRGLLTDGVDSSSNYLDYSVGADVSWKALTFGVSFVGTDVPTRYGRESLVGAGNLLAADNALVFSVGASF